MLFRVPNDTFHYADANQGAQRPGSSPNYSMKHPLLLFSTLILLLRRLLTAFLLGRPRSYRQFIILIKIGIFVFLVVLCRFAHVALNGVGSAKTFFADGAMRVRAFLHVVKTCEMAFSVPRPCELLPAATTLFIEFEVSFQRKSLAARETWSSLSTSAIAGLLGIGFFPALRHPIRGIVDHFPRPQNSTRSPNIFRPMPVSHLITLSVWRNHFVHEALYRRWSRLLACGSRW